MALDDPLMLVGPFSTEPYYRLLVKNGSVLAHPRACCCQICPPDTDELGDVTYWFPSWIGKASAGNTISPEWGTWNFNPGISPEAPIGTSRGGLGWHWSWHETYVYIDELQSSFYADSYFTLGCSNGTWYLYVELAETETYTGTSFYRVFSCPGHLTTDADRGWPLGPWTLEEEWGDDGDWCLSPYGPKACPEP